MTSEAALWQTTKRKLEPFGRLYRCENHAAGPGTPDVHYALRFRAFGSGWVELKEADQPAKPFTPIFVESLTLKQVEWLEGYVRAGGSAWLLLQVRRRYALLQPRGARMIFERKIVVAHLQENSDAYGDSAFPTRAILDALTGDHR